MFSAAFLAKVLGLLRNIIFAKCYGTGLEATSFFTASRIPTQLLDITLGAAISSTFIPVFNEFLQKKGKERAVEFANSFLNIIILIATILSVLGILFAPHVVSLIAPDLAVEAFDLTVQLTRILFPIMIFTAVAFVLVGFLQSMDEFNIPAIISVVSNGILILYLLMFNQRFGIVGVAIAMALGWFTQILVQLPSAKKKGFQYHFHINWKEEGLKKVVILALPILISSWVQPINNIINLRFASGLEEGRAVSAIEYSYTLYLIIIGVFSYTLSNIIFPELSKLSTDKRCEEFNHIIKTSIKVIAMFVLPMAVGIFFLSHHIIELVYERGEFTANSTMLTAKAFRFYAIGMVGYGIMELLNKVFYAVQDSKTPMKTSILAIALNITLSIVLVKQIGYSGLPLAASITSLVVALVMLFVASKKMSFVYEKDFIREIARYVFATIAMGIMLMAIRKFTFGVLLETAISIILGVSIYLVMLWLMESEMLQYGFKMLKQKLKKGEK